MSVYTVKSFYSFTSQPETELENIKSLLCQWAQEYQIVGLVILAVEGINTTLCGDEHSLDAFITATKNRLGLPTELNDKTTYSHFPTFKRFNVKIRQEIVTLDRTDIKPKEQRHRHINPDEWDRLLADSNSVVIDTRNKYETVIGKFKNAIDPEIDEFAQYPDKIAQLQLDKNKNYLLYCTGGIRCEKAIFSMEEMGFKNVFQLEGGILNYLKQKPRGNFEGECFVFDSRVAVDQDLRPSSQFSLCPQCGEVAHIEIICNKCDSPAKLCPTCHGQSQERPDLATCSKNCAYHYRRDPIHKSPQQKRHYHTQAD